MMYELKYSKRKTLSIQIDNNGTVIVRAPLGVDKKYIEDIVYQKSKWISEKKTLKIEQKKHINALKKNNLFLYFGEKYPLEIVRNQDKSLIFFNNVFYLSSDYRNEIDKTFILWYSQVAQNFFTKRVMFFAKKHSLPYSKIKITKAKTKWGSCSSNNVLRFNANLIMFEKKIIDYVIAHELAHTIHKNHSQDFWQLVQVIIPDYKKYHNYLKENSYYAMES